jgi:hypothetical protein
MSYVEYDWGVYPIATFVLVSVIFVVIMGVYYLVKGRERFNEVRGAFFQIYQVTLAFTVGFSFVFVAGTFLRHAEPITVETIEIQLN